MAQAQPNRLVLPPMASKVDRERRIRAIWNEINGSTSTALAKDSARLGFKNLKNPFLQSDGTVERVLAQMSPDATNEIRYKDFVQFANEAEERLRISFGLIDQAGVGHFGFAELGRAYSNLGISITDSDLKRVFSNLDYDKDGIVSFLDWSNSLLFLAPQHASLSSLMGHLAKSPSKFFPHEINHSDELSQAQSAGLLSSSSVWQPLFGTVFLLVQTFVSPFGAAEQTQAMTRIKKVTEVESVAPKTSITDTNELMIKEDVKERTHWQTIKPVLSSFVPNPGYFVAGGVAGIVSRTITAPLDRLKVYLISQTSKAEPVKGSPSLMVRIRYQVKPFAEAGRVLWAAGGMRSLFAGNGLNVVKIMPESAIRFGSYEATKRALAEFQGLSDPMELNSGSRFLAGGIGGIIAQVSTYPIDTIKFRMQCDTVPGGPHGNRLIVSTFQKMWQQSGVYGFYRGMPMGVVGMFPYAAIDLGTFEYMKRWIRSRQAASQGCSEGEVVLGSFTTALIGGISGATGACTVYPLNVLRTRLQSQGTAMHPRTYTGAIDVTIQTFRGEGLRGFYRGLTPNLLKVVPAVSITYVVYEKTKQILHLQ